MVVNGEIEIKAQTIHCGTMTLKRCFNVAKDIFFICQYKWDLLLENLFH